MKYKLENLIQYDLYDRNMVTNTKLKYAYSLSN